jgi:hypothetical protein
VYVFMCGLTLELHAAGLKRLGLENLRPEIRHDKAHLFSLDLSKKAWVVEPFDLRDIRKD